MRRVLLLGAALTTLVAFPRTTDVFGLPKLLALILCVSAVGVLMLPVAWPLVTSRASLLLPSGLFVAGLSLAGILSRQSEFITLYGAMDRANGWLCYTALTLVLVAGAMAFDAASVPLLLQVLAGVGVVEALYGLVQYSGRDPIAWFRPFVVMGTFGNPDFVSGFLGIAAVGLLGLVVSRSTSMRGRIAYGAALLLVLLTIRLSLAIQGLMGFTVGSVVLVGMLLLGLDRPHLVKRLRTPYAVLALGFLVLSALAMTDRGPLARILFKPSVQDRLYMWDAALRMFRMEPLRGVGLDAYGDWYRLVRSPASVAFHGPTVFSNEAHSVLLNLLATGGLLVTLPYLGLWIVVARAAVRAAQDPVTRGPAAILTGAWAAYIADSLVSMDQIGFAVWGWLLAGAILALRPAARIRGVGSPWQRGTTRLLVVGVALGGLASVGYAVQVDHAIGAATLLPTTTPAERAVAISAMTRAGLSCPEPIRVLGVVEELKRIDAPGAAIRVGLDAVRRFPRESLLWQELAVVYESTHQWQRAVAVREHMAVLDPLNSESLHQLALDRAAAG